jgi:hypothetical protein
MRHRRHAAILAVAGLALLALGLSACGGSSSDPTPSGPAMDHTNIVLKDRFGNALTASSQEPYSPRQTCGGCHDVDLVANAYHFQQGRTNAAGTVQMDDDFFADGRNFLLSDGMFGKW